VVDLPRLDAAAVQLCGGCVGITDDDMTAVDVLLALLADSRRPRPTPTHDEQHPVSVPNDGDVILVIGDAQAMMTGL